eukprot:3274017-Rhodomonas_salina.2
MVPFWEGGADMWNGAVLAVLSAVCCKHARRSRYRPTQQLPLQWTASSTWLKPYIVLVPCNAPYPGTDAVDFVGLQVVVTGPEEGHVGAALVYRWDLGTSITDICLRALRNVRY